jgi:hypothetical protein
VQRAKKLKAKEASKAESAWFNPPSTFGFKKNPLSHFLSSTLFILPVPVGL